MESAVGHTIVEAPIVIGLGIGLSALITPGTAKLIGVLGGIVLLSFGLVQIYQAATRKDLASMSKAVGGMDRRSGIFLGVIFTAVNPFFLVWWIAVGSNLIVEALALGAAARVTAMYAALSGWIMLGWEGPRFLRRKENSLLESGTGRS